MTVSDRKRGEPARTGMPALEWIAAATGLLLIGAILGVIGWEALKGNDHEPPAVEAKIKRVTATAGGYIVEVVLRNRSPSTAAAVQVEGELKRGGETLETSGVTIDYVPGQSTRQAGLFFDQDPRTLDLKVRALGYAKP